MCSNLTWSHYREVLSLGIFNEIKYYLEECENKNLSVRELHFKIKTKEYERLSKKVKQNLEKTKKLKIDDLIPNPIIIKSKPSTVKGQYLKNISVAPTMGPGIKIDLSSFDK